MCILLGCQIYQYFRFCENIIKRMLCYEWYFHRFWIFSWNYIFSWWKENQVSQRENFKKKIIWLHCHCILSKVTYQPFILSLTCLLFWFYRILLHACYLILYRNENYVFETENGKGVSVAYNLQTTMILFL